MSNNDKIFELNSGKYVLDQLERFGSDIKQSHEFTFCLYFPTEKLAQKAAHHAEKSGFKTEVSPPLKKFPDSGWLCLLICPHIPDEEILDGIAGFCTKLTNELNGKFDGRETKMELPAGGLPPFL